MSQGTHGHEGAHEHGHVHGEHCAHGAPAAHGEHGHDPHGGGAHGAHGEGESHGPTRSTFITIWLTLGFLTIVEIMVPRVYDAPWNHHTKMLLLVILAVGKAMLVAMYFMHLKWEKPWLKRIALLPAYMGFATVVLMIEEAWRNTLS